MSDEVRCTRNETRDVHALGGALEDLYPILEGNADELGARRPHPDAHLYDIEESLRMNANYAQNIIREEYYR
jgi:hypothetical protein